MSNTCIVTGAAGHLGAAMVDCLLAAGHPVRALVLPEDPLKARVPDQVAIQEGDLLDPETCDKLLEDEGDGPPTVFHCAGIVSTSMKPNPRLQAVNVEGTANLLRACRVHGIRRLVHVSSVHALPELAKGEVVEETTTFSPNRVVGPYAKSKAIATQLVLDAAQAGLNASVVFPTGICGPGDFAMGRMTSLLIAFGQNRMRIGVQGGFDFVDVRDVAAGMLQCAELGKSGEGYILGNRYLPIREIFTLFSRYTGIRPVRRYAPLWLARFGLPVQGLLDSLGKRPKLFNPYALYTLSGETRYSHRKAARDLGYVTRPFEETVRDTVDWLRQENFLSTAPYAPTGRQGHVRR